MRKIIPVIIGTMFTMPTFAISVAPVSGASVTDAGQYSGYTCVKVTGSGLPVTDTSLPTTDTSKCSATAAIAYQSNFSGGGVGSTVYQKDTVQHVNRGIRWKPKVRFQHLRATVKLRGKNARKYPL